MHKMAELQPTIDFKKVSEDGKVLPVSWVSSYNSDIDAARAYVRECRERNAKPDLAKLEVLVGNERAHLRQTTLMNGLRWVTIHLDNGEEIFDEHEFYKPVISESGTISDYPARTAARVIPGIDLGDGFVLKTILAGHLKGRGGTESYVEKTFKTGRKRVILNYCITPESGNATGHLGLFYDVHAFLPMPRKLKERARKAKTQPKQRFGQTIGKYQVLNMQTPPKAIEDEENYPHCVSSFFIVHNLPDHYTGNSKHDRMEFYFGVDGRLTRIMVLSQSNNPNPEWTRKDVLEAIKKGSNTPFNYPPESPEARILSQEIFGRDITQLQHNARETLNAIVAAAIDEANINVAKTLNFL